MFLSIALDVLIVCAGLLKDFGWMTTNVYLGFPFGVISVALHAFLLVYDPRRSYRFYNFSLLVWVVGNFLWMTVEFASVHPSSHIHMGSHVPLGGIPEQTIDNMVNVKTILFLVSSVVQVGMYLGIACKLVDLPEGEDEDLISKNEVMLLFYGDQSYERQQDAALDDNVDIGDNITLTGPGERSSYSLTLAYIENLYIVFWVSKDLFWSWGTGDLINGFDLAIFYEATAMCFGTLSLLVHLVTAYIYRRNTLLLLDSITTILWISANFVWMCGEFFIRYDNLAHDDEDQGNDTGTRIASAVLFCLGLTIQLYIMVSLLAHRRGKAQAQPQAPTVEMTSFKLPLRYTNILITFSPQHEHVQQMDEEEESTILF